MGRMNRIASNLRPDWVSDDMYPFESRFFATESGHRMHFVDEGEGEPIVFVHGNPTWSFEFRHAIRELRSEYRCVAPDHIGFGLSSRSSRQEDHHPKSHARRLAALLDYLELQDVSLFMNDWGGPIGLDFARRHPGRIKRLVITNTWCWPVGDDFHFKAFSFFMSNRVGQYVLKRHNFFVRSVMPMAVGNRSILTPEIMAHYRNALPSPHERTAMAAFPGHIVGASDWLRSVWDDRMAFADKPTLLLWGLKDIAFRTKELERWKSELSDHELHEYEECGHFLAEEAPDRVVAALRDFMGRTKRQPGGARKPRRGCFGSRTIRPQCARAREPGGRTCQAGSGQRIPVLPQGWLKPGRPLPRRLPRSTQHERTGQHHHSSCVTSSAGCTRAAGAKFIDAKDASDQADGVRRETGTRKTPGHYPQNAGACGSGRLRYALPRPPGHP